MSNGSREAIKIALRSKQGPGPFLTMKLSGAGTQSISLNAPHVRPGFFFCVFVAQIRLLGGLACMFVQSTNILDKHFQLDENCLVNAVKVFLEKKAVDLLYAFSY